MPRCILNEAYVLAAIAALNVAESVRLGTAIDDPSLDIKKMVGETSYRLRVGDWRIIFEREDVLKIISVDKIKARGDLYK